MEPIQPWRLRAILGLIGLSAIIAQVVLMRELLVVFYGNEMSLGLMLANWLLWTAVGAALSGRIVQRFRNPLHPLATLQVLLALAFPLTIFAVRATRVLFHALPGEILGPGHMFLASLLVLGPLCAISGGLFSAGSHLCLYEVKADVATATGRVYMLEAAGSAVGGLLASLLLIRFLGAFDIAVLVAILNLLAMVSLFASTRGTALLASVALLAVWFFFLVPFGIPALERISLRPLWRGFHLLESRNSVYGNLAVVEGGGSRSIFENGLILFSAPDPAAAEESVHYALLQHGQPSSLLLIGGGVNGSLAQALQHPTLKKVDYVELDPTVLDLAAGYFPHYWTPVSNDPRVTVHHLDGRVFLKRTNQRFDVIVVNLPDPQTAQLNRFYTEEFFREVTRSLNPGGVFSFRVTGAENYLSPQLAEFLRCVKRTLDTVFPEVIAFPGGMIHFFGARHGGTLTTDPAVLVARLRARQLQTIYVREYYLPFRLMPDRLLDLETQMQPLPTTPINRDFTPTAYYFSVALWSTRFQRPAITWFDRLARVKFEKLTAWTALCLLVLLLGLYLYSGVSTDASKRAHRPRFAVCAGFSVSVMGLTLMALQIILLLGFQAIYGYLYHQLALLIAAFMVGMAVGSHWQLRRGLVTVASRVGLSRGDLLRLASLQIVGALSTLGIYALLVSFAQVRSAAGALLTSQVAFPTMALLSGLLGGYQFPLASKIYFSQAGTTKRGIGALYGLDLVGAGVGAVLLSLYLIPVFGFLHTAMFTALLNAAPTFLVLLSSFLPTPRK